MKMRQLAVASAHAFSSLLANCRAGLAFATNLTYV
jgi:hypothetical protein